MYVDQEEDYLQTVGMDVDEGQDYQQIVIIVIVIIIIINAKIFKPEQMLVEED